MSRSCSPLRPHLGRTPVPYTTLFRSLGEEATMVRAIISSTRLLMIRPAAICSWSQPLQRLSQAVGNRCSTTLPDRKSTRLNSSHLVISYADFCLKKKIPNKDDYDHD